jgi:hypothetical protein
VAGRQGSFGKPRVSNAAEKILKKSFPKVLCMCTMRPLADVLATDAGGARKKIRGLLTESKMALRYLAHLDGNAG